MVIKMNEHSNIPKIRFKGFNNVWEQRKLEEISNRFDNLRVPVSANEREKGTTPYYGANGIQDYVKGFTHNGEYVLIAEDGANDLKNYPVKYVNGLFWANNHVHVVQGKEGICDNKYLKYCFTKTNIESLLVGGGRAKLNANIMMGIDLTVPSFNEQVELGRLFYEIDNLITLHQRKYMRNFYSWEQRKFDSLARIERGLTYSPTDLNNNGIRVLRSSNIDENYFKLYDEDVFVNPKSINIDFANNNDILITSANGSSRLVGKHAIISGISSNSTVHGGFMLLAKPYINSYFLNASMSSNWYKKFIDLYVAGGNGAIGNLSKADLDNQLVYVPKESEINKIGELFTNLDNLITLHQHKEIKRRKDKNEHLRWQ